MLEYVPGRFLCIPRVLLTMVPRSSVVIVRYSTLWLTLGYPLPAAMGRAGRGS